MYNDSLYIRFQPINIINYWSIYCTSITLNIFLHRVFLWVWSIDLQHGEGQNGRNQVSAEYQWNPTVNLLEWEPADGCYTILNSHVHSYSCILGSWHSNTERSYGLHYLYDFYIRDTVDNAFLHFKFCFLWSSFRTQIFRVNHVFRVLYATTCVDN